MPRIRSRSCRENERLVRHVEREHRDRSPTVEHDGGGIGIDVDVELGDRCCVPALEESATHQGDLADLRDDRGFTSDCRSDVGEGADRAQRDSLVHRGEARLDDEVDGVFRRSVGHRRGEISTIDTCRTVDILRSVQVALERPIGPGEYPDIGPSDEFAQLQRVRRDEWLRDVAGDSGDVRPRRVPATPAPAARRQRRPDRDLYR